MEAHKNYIDFNELVSSIARIVNNLDQMTEIMTTTSVKITPEKEKQIKNVLYGMSVARPLPDYDPEILRSEMQDLKLENDRLQQRNKLMIHFIESVACKPDVCNFCDMYNYEDDDNKCCILNNLTLLKDTATELLNKLEEL